MLLILNSIQVFAGGNVEKKVDNKINDAVKLYMTDVVKQPQFEILSIQSQVVAGLKIKFTVKYGGERAVLTVWKKLTGEVEVTDFAVISGEI
ncbi:Proteinase_inhibitor I25 [Hexamita inflata]|uniref:Conserved site n=1 Tax=Hexamita inflata TaxID=28002 RepID=A0AA86URZ8_9EUKA|nr:Proteinase inhibitor I25 [Hexamita inflata]